MKDFLKGFILSFIFVSIISWAILFMAYPPYPYGWLDVLGAFSTLLIGVAASIISLAQLHLSRKSHKSDIADKRRDSISKVLQVLDDMLLRVTADVSGDVYEHTMKLMAEVQMMKNRFPDSVSGQVERDILKLLTYCYQHKQKPPQFEFVKLLNEVRNKTLECCEPYIRYDK